MNRRFYKYFMEFIYAAQFTIRLGRYLDYPYLACILQRNELEVDEKMEPTHILVIEDDDIVARTIERSLRGEDFHVTIANSGV